MIEKITCKLTLYTFKKFYCFYLKIVTLEAILTFVQKPFNNPMMQFSKFFCAKVKQINGVLMGMQ